MSVDLQPSHGAGSTYCPATRTERWVDGSPCARPETPIWSLRSTTWPTATPTTERYETETLMPPAASIVTELVPATLPANVTTPETGAATTVPTGAP